MVCLVNPRATPAFILSFVATILLAVVVFCVPYVKTVYFLKAAVDYQSVSGNITFGTLGYCVQLSGITTCSKPTIGYQLDINRLVGNSLPIQIPEGFVKLVTTLLVFHVIALVAAVASASFNLLAHLPGISLIPCFGSCFSGLAATVTFTALAIDFALFFLAQARINAVGSAHTGNAIWLTLAAWILLLFSGCLNCCG